MSVLEPVHVCANELGEPQVAAAVVMSNVAVRIACTCVVSCRIIDSFNIFVEIGSLIPCPHTPPTFNRRSLQLRGSQ